MRALHGHVAWLWAGLMLLGAGPAARLTAAVPESVAVRKQLPEVERIISALETKALGAQGTWSIRTAPKDKPAESWSMSLGKSQKWLWRSEAVETSPNHGYLMVSEGGDTFIVPHGTDHREGAVRVQYDSVLKGGFPGDESFSLGQFLVQMNLCPREFIGALGGLKIVGEEEIDGTKVVHLRADPQADAIFSVDPAFNEFTGLSPGGHVRPVIDLYYDPAREAVAKVVVAPPGALGRELMVSGWDKFGTATDWPNQITGRRVAAVSGKTFTAGPLQITSVINFAPGADKAVDEAAASVKQLVFATPLDSLRSVDFYEKSVKESDVLTERIALAEAYFSKGNAQAGLQQWQLAEAKVSNPSDRLQLSRILVLPAANVLSPAMRANSQRQSAVLVLTRLGALDDDAFRTVAGQACTAWIFLRQIPDSTVAAKRMEQLLLPRIVKLGDVFALQQLMELAKEENDAALLRPYFDTLLAQPMPAKGGDQSQQHRLVLAAIRANSLDQASRALAGMRWPDDAAVEDKDAVALWGRAIAAAKDMEGDRDAGVESAISVFDALAKTYKNKSQPDRVYGQWFLARAGAAFLDHRLDNPGSKPVQALLRQTLKLDGSADFWRDTITNAAKNSVLKPQRVLTTIGPVLRIYRDVYSQPQFECDLWINLSQDSQLRGRFLGTELDYVNKALAAASDDAARVKALDAMANTYVRVQEFANGAQAIRNAAGLLKDEQLRKKVLAGADRIAAREAVAAGSSKKPQ
jgi:hypothetical protein